MANSNLANAKRAKNDEFYTQFDDIQKEINAYIEYNPGVFKGKTILLPCDDPEWSMDYGPKEKNQTPSEWSYNMIHRAEENGLLAVTKRVKYIHNSHNPDGYDKKCDLDVDMAIDLVKMKDYYDNIVLFSGDGDLMCATNYLKKEFNKNVYVFSARGHIGKEVIDALKDKMIDLILYVEDFEYRLNMDIFRCK